MELRNDDLWWAQENNMEVIFKGQKKLKMGIRVFAILKKFLLTMPKKKPERDFKGS